MKRTLALALIMGCVSLPLCAQMGGNISSPPDDFTSNVDPQAQDNHTNNGKNGPDTGGCEDSPENPTIVLASLALAGFGLAQLRRKKVALSFNSPDAVNNS